MNKAERNQVYQSDTKAMADYADFSPQSFNAVSQTGLKFGFESTPKARAFLTILAVNLLAPDLDIAPDISQADKDAITQRMHYLTEVDDQ